MPGPRAAPPRLGGLLAALVIVGLAAPASAQTDPFEQALAAESRGDVAEARRLYTQIVAATPDHGRAWVNLGLLEVRRGRTKAGKAHCNRALDLDPEASKVHYCLGLALLREDTAQAAAAFEQAIALLSNDPAPKIELAHLRREAKRYDEAVQLYREAVRARPDDPDLHVHLGYCYRKLGQLAAARVEYAKAVQKDPKSYFGHLDLGWVLVKLKDYDGAETHYLQAAKLKPEAADPHYNLGNLYRRRGQPVKAADAYAAAVERDPDDVQARLALVRAAWRAHRGVVAKQHLAALEKQELSPARAEAVAKLRALVQRAPPPLPSPAPSP